MIAFICLFFPAVVSVWIFEALTKRNPGLKKTIFLFCTNALIINFLCFLMKKFIFGTADVPLYAAQYDMYPTVAVNYIICAAGIAVIISVIEALLAKKVRVSIDGKSGNEDETETEKTDEEKKD
ncbi:MAG: hypothetical protein J5940_01680 [Clostridia bacterium]|nr:hypothetical protein [Clostridia bacterium]